MGEPFRACPNSVAACGGHWLKENTLISNYNGDPLFRFIEEEGERPRLNCRGEAMENNSSEADGNDVLAGKSLAMVYSPIQPFEGLLEPAAALAAGTVFRALEKPFYGARRLK